MADRKTNSEINEYVETLQSLRAQFLSFALSVASCVNYVLKIHAPFNNITSNQKSQIIQSTHKGLSRNDKSAANAGSCLDNRLHVAYP